MKTIKMLVNYGQFKKDQEVKVDRRTAEFMLSNSLACIVPTKKVECPEDCEDCEDCNKAKESPKSTPKKKPATRKKTSTTKKPASKK